MAIHYCASQEAIACGRTGASLSSTQDLSQVSCKLCLRSVEKGAAEPVRKTPSLAELRAAAKAAKAAAETPSKPAADEPAIQPARAASAPAKPAVTAVSAPAVRAPAAAKPAAAKPATALSPRAEWKQRLQQMPGRNRLPRGFAK